MKFEEDPLEIVADGGSVDELNQKIDAFAARLQRYWNNQPLQGIADFKRGY